MTDNSTYDAIVLGAGGAGLMCAATAGQMGARVLVLDHAAKAGKKILISGGGRCNFTNTGTRAENFLSKNPHFAKSALSRYSPQDFIDLVNRHGIDWHEKTLGQLFCDGSARQIVAMLLAECAKGGVTVRLGTDVSAIGHDGGGFVVNDRFRAKALVVATGGPSIPKMGATGFAYDIARQFGLKVVEPRPGLVPLTLGPNDLLAGLSGVSVPVLARADGPPFAEAALFTHKGLSGPAILQASSYWHPGQPVTLDLLPGLPAGWLRSAKREMPRSQLKTVLTRHMPDRLAAALADRFAISRELGNCPDAQLAQVEADLAAWSPVPSGTEGFAKAEVTVGGVDTAGLSSRTMEAKKLPGLFVIGEAVDVTGWLGGYNFQWAWASGHAAGEAIAERAGGA